MHVRMHPLRLNPAALALTSASADSVQIDRQLIESVGALEPFQPARHAILCAAFSGVPAHHQHRSDDTFNPFECTVWHYVAAPFKCHKPHALTCASRIVS